MSDLKLLFVEDASNDLNTFRATIKRYNRQKKRAIKAVEAVSLTDALGKLNSTFDGAIIDLRLGPKGDEGNRVIEEIASKYRIPIAVMTATPQNAQAEISYLGIFTKGETGYDELLEKFCRAYDTGVTKILGGRGYLEETMNKVFWNSILPYLEDWQRYSSQSKKTEKALLRFTVNHIVDLLDSNSEIYFPEEMYIAPTSSTEVKTGSIVKRKAQDQYYVVLSPACDLAKHNGQMKTDRILVCLIEETNIDLIQKARKDIKIKINRTDDKKTKLAKKSKKEKAEKILSQIPRNNYSYHFHYLPKTKVFRGGIINFRKVEAFKPNDYKNEFEDPIAQISMTFSKDIVARFSSYYARQGQPDFDFDTLTKLLSE